MTVLEEIELGLFTCFEDTTALEDKKGLTVFSAKSVVDCTYFLAPTSSDHARAFACRFKTLRIYSYMICILITIAINYYFSTRKYIHTSLHSLT